MDQCDVPGGWKSQQFCLGQPALCGSFPEQSTAEAGDHGRSTGSLHEVASGYHGMR
jgi:hypothetical protein